MTCFQLIKPHGTLLNTGVYGILNVTPCEANPHPLDDFTTEKVEGPENQRMALRNFPPLKEYWSKADWEQTQGTVRLGA